MKLSAASKFPCGHDRPVLSVSWGASGLIAAAGGDNSVRVYAEPPSRTGNTVTEEDEPDPTGGWREVGAAEAAHEDDVNCVAWHPTDRTTLVSCSDDGTAKVWSVRSKGTAGQTA